ARGTIYSYGGWTASLDPRYYKRYKYRGNMSLQLQHIKRNFKGDPDYRSDKTVKIGWQHNADMKSRPGVTFQASVNAGSSKFNEQKPNNPTTNFENLLNSTISYSKTWKDKPYNLAIRASHNQNTNLRLINIFLPEVNFNVNTLYPFRRSEPVGNMKWYENLGIALNTSAKSFSSFYDTAGHVFNQLSTNFQWGATHNVPITLALPSLGPLQITPSVGYQERWYQRKFYRVWNPTDKRVDTVINNGFFTARDMNFSISAGTRIFGMYTFNKNNRISAIRHEIRPTLSVTYKPDMNAYSHYNTQTDTLGNVNRFSVFDNTVAGAFGEGKFAGLSFSIDNNISMKVRNKKDTSSTDLKKVSLIDGLSIGGAYNFLADSFALSLLNLSARTNLFGKVSITATANLDPYLSDTAGNRIDKLVWSKHPLSLGKITSGNISMQSSFRGGDDKGLTTPSNPSSLTPINPDGYLLDEFQQEALYIRNNPGEFADFSIPWNVDISYSLRFGRVRKPDYSGFKTEFFQDVNINGSINLTPKWKIGMTALYNITNKEIGSLSMYLSRDMHCWQMAINIAPVGRYRFFTITI
ncbi:MAG: putative LPS assembly protein LptD, partial [Ferruginibacter sp.]